MGAHVAMNPAEKAELSRKQHEYYLVLLRRLDSPSARKARNAFPIVENELSTTGHAVTAHVEELNIEPESPGPPIPHVGLSHFVIPGLLGSIDDTTPADMCVALLSYFIRLHFLLLSTSLLLIFTATYVWCHIWLH
ncbi:hypothetical protein LIER_39559 [Lithospermum erythrorhizon]|uniref:Uncharacterized protein n=1 Tax=Lithospermum erythrorhizon TaxID=34254 RepID=A0AAV3QL09_LITER